MSEPFSTPPPSHASLVVLPTSPSRDVLEVKVADAASKYPEQWNLLVQDMSLLFNLRRLDANIFGLLMPQLRDDALEVTRYFDINLSLCTSDSLNTAWRLAKAKYESRELTAAQATAYLLVKVRTFGLTSRPTTAPFAKEMSNHLDDHLREPFHGDAVDKFLAFVHRTHTTLHDKSPYYLGTPIVQSSGTGKTRLVLQLATKVPLLYLCARQPTPSGANQGFPPGDSGVSTYFRSAQDPNVTAAAFIGALFSHIAHHLEQQHHVTAKFQFLQDLLNFSTWQKSERDKLERDELFLRIVEDAEHKRHRELQQSGNQTHQGYEPMFSRCLDEPVARLSAQMRAIANDTTGTNISEIPTTQRGHPIFFVAIDECVDLDEGNKQEASRLESLRRAWNYVNSLEASHKVCFWLVLLSTNSSAARLVTPAALLGSQRAVEAPQMPAFCNLGFDVKLSEQRPLKRARDAAQLDQLCYYGRPLWVAQCMAHKNRLLDFWLTTRAKLLNSTSDVVGSNDFDYQVSIFNILASRLSFQSLPVQQAGVHSTGPSLAQASIDRHMRVLKKIVDHEKLVISAPSEPVLAIAAAEVMTELDKNRPSSLYPKMLSLFTKTTLSPERLISFKGDVGELATRVILMCASDACKRALTASPIDKREDRAMHLAKPIALSDLVGKLAVLDDAAQARIHHRIVNTVGQVGTELIKSLKLSGHVDDLAKEAWVSFTHFDTVPYEIDEITPGFLWACWKRGVAIQTDHYQHGIDGIIPVFLGSLDLPFASVMARFPLPQHKVAQESYSELIESLVAPELMSYVAWSTKNRGRPLSVSQRSEPVTLGPVIRRAADIGRAADIDAKKPEAPKRRGFLTIEFDLGTTAAFATKDLSADHVRLSDHKTLNGSFLTLRGIEDPAVYPCLEDFGCRDALRQILQPDLTTDDMMPDPLDSLIRADRDQCTFGEVGDRSRELFPQMLLELGGGGGDSEGDVMMD